MKHWKTTQRAVRKTDVNFCYLCPGRSISSENILNMLSLMAQVLMDEVIHCHTYSDQYNFNTKEAKIL